MNRFEIATLRILFKTQNPIPISRLVEGFPSDYEDSVLEAITNLFKLGYILYPDAEKPGSVTYNKVKGREILKIIDPPLPELPEPKVEVEQAVPPKKEAASTNEGKPRKHASQIVLMMSVLAFSILGIFSAIPTTENVSQNSKLLDSNYNYHYTYNPMFGSHDVEVYSNPAGNFGSCNHQYLNSGGDLINRALFFTHTDLRNYVHVSSF